MLAPEPLSKNELRVEELLLRWVPGLISAVPSCADRSVGSSFSETLIEAFDLRRKLKSLMKDGIVLPMIGKMFAACI